MSLVVLGLALVLAYLALWQSAATHVELRLAASAAGAVSALSVLDRARWPMPGRSRTALALAAALPFYGILQVLPLPTSLIGILSKGRAHWLDQLSAFSPAAPFAALSAAPASTFLHVFLVTACALTFVLVWRATRAADRRRYWIPAIPLMVLATLEACLGIAQYLNRAPVQGTYVNKNHYTGLLELVLPLAVAYGWSGLLKAVREPRALGAWVQGFAGSAAAVLCFAGAMLGLSKAGTISVFFGLCVMSSLAIWSSLTGWTRWAAAAGCVVTCSLGFLLFPTDELTKAFGQVQLGDMEGRRPVASDTANLIRDYALAGAGLGAYGSVFSKYQTTNIDNEFTYAHNDYLQILSELGIPGAALAAIFLFLVVRHGLRALLESTEPAVRHLAFGCLGAVAAIAVHSAADFNLYVPPNAIVLAWIFGITAGLPLASGERTPDAPWLGRATAAAGLALAGVGVLTLWVVPGSSRAAQQQGPPPPPDILRALTGEAASPTLWSQLGESYLQLGQPMKASQSFLIAEEAGPYVPASIMRLARGNFELGNRDTAFQQMRKILDKTGTAHRNIFHWYRFKQIPVAEVLAKGIPDRDNAVEHYCRYLIQAGDAQGAALAWNRLLGRGWVGASIARDYSHFLFQQQNYQFAARELARYLETARQSEFQHSSFVLNGDFENPPMGTDFDWTIESLQGARVTVDGTVAHTGKNSLKIHFDGSQNLAFQHVRQAVFLPPGDYRLSAFVKTGGITTNEGVGLQITAIGGRFPLHSESDRLVGTNDWKKVELAFHVPADGTLASIQVVRRQSFRFVNQIAGTAWVDGVVLTRQ